MNQSVSQSAPTLIAHRTISNEEFQRYRDRVEEVVQHFRPSGSNGRLQPMLLGIKRVLAAEGVREGDYYDEVLRRSNRVVPKR